MTSKTDSWPLPHSGARQNNKYVHSPQPSPHMERGRKSINYQIFTR